MKVEEQRERMSVFQTSKYVFYSVPELFGSATYLFTVCQALEAFLWPQTASISVKIEEIANVKKEGIIIETSDFKALPGACWIGHLSEDRSRGRKRRLQRHRINCLRWVKKEAVFESRQDPEKKRDPRIDSRKQGLQDVVFRTSLFALHL